jgi:hypothetical protein
LLTSANFAANPFAVSDYLMFLGHGGPGGFPDLSEIHVRVILGGLIDRKDLEDHWIQEFISRSLKVHPAATLDFLFKRVERACETADWTYTPIAHGSLVTVPLNLLALEEGTRWLDYVLDWAFQAVPSERLRTHVAELVQALCPLFGPALVAGLRRRLSCTTREEMKLITAILSEAPADFVFDHREFAHGVLRIAKRIGQESYHDALFAFHRSTISGVRQGTPGEPFPQDLRLKEQAERALVGLDHMDPAYELYLGIMKGAEQSIRRQLDDGLRMKELDEID